MLGKKIKLQNYAVRLIGVVLLAVILLNIDFAKVLTILSKANLWLAGGALLLLIPLIFIKAIRWRLLLETQEIKFSLLDAFLVYFIGLFVGSVTPGRLGDFIKIAYVKEKGESGTKAFTTVLLDRVFDLGFFVLIGYASLIVFLFESGQASLESTLLLIVAPFVLLALFLASKNYFNYLLKKIVVFMTPDGLSVKVKNKYKLFITSFKTLNAGNISAVTSLTLLGWSVYFFQMYLFAIAIGINLPFSYIALVVSLAGFLVLLPISISGIGTRDALFIFMLTPLGVSAEAAVGFSFLILMVYLFSALLGGSFFILKPISPKRLRKQQGEFFES